LNEKKSLLTSALFEFLKIFFMLFFVPGRYLKIPSNKKFFIPELILIFVPLQKIHPRKSVEKLNPKQYLTSLKLLFL